MQFDSSADITQSVQVEPLTLTAADGMALSATLFEPRVGALGTVIIHAATAVPARYYRHFAGFLATRGLRVISYDYRGVGGSRPRSLRGFSATMTDWARLDAAAAHAFVSQRFAADPMAMVGHSFGGQLMGLLDAPHEAMGALLVASQLGYFGHWSRREQLRLGLIWGALVPVLSASFGYLPGQAGIGEDLPRGVAEEWARWCRSPGYLMDYHPDARARYARFDKPVLAYSFSDDEFAPPRAVSALLKQLSAAQISERRVQPNDFDRKPIGHFGFFRPRFASTLWLEAAKFLENVLQRKVIAQAS